MQVLSTYCSTRTCQVLSFLADYTILGLLEDVWRAFGVFWHKPQPLKIFTQIYFFFFVDCVSAWGFPSSNRANTPITAKIRKPTTKKISNCPCGLELSVSQMDGRGGIDSDIEISYSEMAKSLISSQLLVRYSFPFTSIIAWGVPLGISCMWTKRKRKQRINLGTFESNGILCLSLL